MMHIYTARMQPATNFIDQCGAVEYRGGFKPYEMIYAQCCGKKRPAKNCVVQCYYDGISIWCSEGHGCKNPRSIAAKRWKEHMNRSRAQQARRAREMASALRALTKGE